jgi:hypothetical protein
LADLGNPYANTYVRTIYGRDDVYDILARWSPWNIDFLGNNDIPWHSKSFDPSRAFDNAPFIVI